MIDLPLRIPMWRRFAASFGLLCFLCCLAAAQTETIGRVTGVVTDPTGAAISAARINTRSRRLAWAGVGNVEGLVQRVPDRSDARRWREQN